MSNIKTVLSVYQTTHYPFIHAFRLLNSLSFESPTVMLLPLLYISINRMTFETKSPLGPLK